MAKYVMKFGGTSLKDAEAIKRVYNIVRSFYQAKKPDQLIVVVSGPGKVGEGKLEDKFTNLLEQIHRNENFDVNKREILSRMGRICSDLRIKNPRRLYKGFRQLTSGGGDRGYSETVSYGERFSIRAVSDFFRLEGLEARSLDYDRFGMLTEGNKDASATEQANSEIEKSLANKRGVIVLPGFLGFNKAHEVTTLGRDGSNYTATKVAEAIEADEVFIFSDEPGVRRASPKHVPDAEVLKELSYDEAIEFAELGAKIINAKSIYPAIEANLPISIVDENFRGTRISGKVSLEHMGAKIIASSSDNYVLTVRYRADKPGVLRRIGGGFEDAGINIEGLGDERHALSLAFSQDEIKNIGEVMEKLKDYNLSLENGFARISVIGEGMRHQVGLLNRITSCFSDKGISFEMASQSAHQLNVSSFIPQIYERMAVRKLYDELFGKD